MLILCRKPGEQFVIGEDVTVTVQRVQGKRVWLTFDAPRTVTIDRQEVHRKRALPQGSTLLKLARSAIANRNVSAALARN
jgi:carbon storage regulator